MADILRIKRRSTGNPGAPASLAYAELAYNEVDDILYYGKGNNAGAALSIIPIAGPGFAGGGAGGPFLPLTAGPTVPLTGNLYITPSMALGGMTLPSDARNGQIFAANYTLSISYPTAFSNNVYQASDLSWKYLSNGWGTALNTSNAAFSFLRTNVSGTVGNTVASWVEMVRIDNGGPSGWGRLYLASSSSNMQLFDDGNSHIESSVQLWLNGNAPFKPTTVGGPLNCNSTINVAGSAQFTYVVISGPDPLRLSYGANTAVRVYTGNSQRNWSFGVNGSEWALSDETAGDYGILTVATDKWTRVRGLDAGSGTVKGGLLQAPRGIIDRIDIYGGVFYNGYNDNWLYFNGSLRVYNLNSQSDVTANNNMSAVRYYMQNGHYLQYWNGYTDTGQPFHCGAQIVAEGSLSSNSGLVYLAGMYWQNNGGWMYCPWNVRTDGNLRTNNDVELQNVLRNPWARGGKIETMGWDYDWLAHFISAGTLYVSPNKVDGFYYSGGYWPSDASLKKNIRDSEIDALGLIMTTPVRAFEYTEDGLKRLGTGAPRRTVIPIGLVAQELERTMPEAVQVCAFEHASKLIEAHHIIPYLFRAVQQLAEQNAALLARIEQLEGRVND